jgi:hypothetical protein
MKLYNYHCISLSASNHNLWCNIIHYVQIEGTVNFFHFVNCFPFVLSCLILLCFVFAFISCDCRTYYKMYIRCNYLIIYWL